jgi:Regulator of chromosome condensation (RCC1) repeat
MNPATQKRLPLVAILALIAASATVHAQTGGLTIWGEYGIAESASSRAPIVKIVTKSERTAAVRADGTVVLWNGYAPEQQGIPLGLHNVVSAVPSEKGGIALLTDGTIQSWGATGVGNVPDGLKLPKALSTSYLVAVGLQSDGTVVAWGNNYFGDLDVPQGLNRVVALSSGRAHHLALRDDGSVVAWGSNNYGQGTVPTNVSQMTAIASSDYYNLVLKSDGTVQAWGSAPEVPASLTNVVAISASNNESLALKSDGTVTAWGYVPTHAQEVIQNLTHVVAISSGYPESYAIKDDGTIVSWGVDKRYNLRPPSGCESIIDFCSGGSNFLALRSDGKVVAWGSNDYHESEPPANLGKVIAVAAGYGFDLALQADGKVVAWGDDTYGITSVPPTLANVKAISAGYYFGVALREDGTVATWGPDANASLTVPAGLTDVTAISAGTYHVLALKRDGTVVAWGGTNFYGETTVPPDLKDVVAIAAGEDCSLAVRKDGTVVGWGHKPPIPDGFNAVSIDASQLYTIALRADHTAVFYYYLFGWLPIGNGGISLVHAGQWNPGALMLTNLLASNWSVAPGNATTVTLTMPVAPTTNVDVNISASSPSVKVPTTVKVMAGSHTATFTATTTKDFTGTAMIEATYLGAKSYTTVTSSASPSVISLKVNPNSVKAGGFVQGTVTLNNPASGIGTVVSLSTEGPAWCGTSVTVPSGQTSATFQIGTSGVSARTTAVIYARTGDVVRSDKLSVTPAKFTGLTLDPTSVVGGVRSTGTLTMDGQAPQGGLAVTLKSNRNDVKVPDSVLIPGGQSSVNFNVDTTITPFPITATITATADSVTKRADLEIKPLEISSVSITASPIKGGATAFGKVFLNGPAGPNGLYVGFTSDQSAVMPQQAIFIREGSTSGSFICPTAAVEESTTATISASALSSLKKVTLTVNAYFLTSFTGPSSIQQNAPGVATIVIDEPAPVGGLPVSFVASSSAVRIRKFILVPAGRKSTKVNFRARAVTADTDVTITAKLAKATMSFTVTVKK